MKSIRVAVVAWKLRPIKSDGEFFGHYHDIISSAHDEGANFIVFPENHSFELLGIADKLNERDIPKFLHQYAEQIEEWTVRISRSSGMTIFGGTHLKLTDDGPRNVCPVVTPDGEMVLVEKNRLTQHERNTLNIGSGKSLALPNNRNLGATICYDVEFPESCRTLAEVGVLALSVPAYTETRHGFHRVRSCCHARAIENQIYVLHASLVGSLHRVPTIKSFGSSAIISPCIEPFPANGLIRETKLNSEGFVIANLDFELLLSARDQGNVRNWNDRFPYDWNSS